MKALSKKSMAILLSFVMASTALGTAGFSAFAAENRETAIVQADNQGETPDVLIVTDKKEDNTII